MNASSDMQAHKKWKTIARREISDVIVARGVTARASREGYARRREKNRNLNTKARASVCGFANAATWPRRLAAIPPAGATLGRYRPLCCAIKPLYRLGFRGFAAAGFCQSGQQDAACFGDLPRPPPVLL
jgi:hypothetical protein